MAKPGKRSLNPGEGEWSAVCGSASTIPLEGVIVRTSTSPRQFGLGIEV